jgi:hypothetical protein
MKYRRKPLVVDATPWLRPGDHPAVTYPVPAHVAIPAGRDCTQLGAIETLEGWMLVSPGDLIVRGVHGEHYACKPEIFRKTYELAEENSA